MLTNSAIAENVNIKIMSIIIKTPNENKITNAYFVSDGAGSAIEKLILLTKFC